MTTLTREIFTNNINPDPNPEFEVARILDYNSMNFANAALAPPINGILRDRHGNTVGTYSTRPTEEAGS